MTENFYEEYDTDNSLADFVKRFWKFSNPTANTQHYTILPDGYFDLIVTISNNKLDNISLYGIWTKQFEVKILANTTVLGITFKPIATDYILKQSIADILNSSKVLAKTFWNIDNLPFNDFTSFVTQLSTIISTNIKTDNRKIETFNLLFNSFGSLTVEELSNKVFWSSRQINRYFKNSFGLSLKTYANILRCSASYTDIRQGELSPSLNYYDQSHFIKEIKKYTGSNPKELHQNKNDRFLQFYTLPK